MANLKFNHVYKVYPNGVKAVNDFTMDVEDKEFIVFVGPSGCGKSTTLRMIAGLEEISSGELFIGDRMVNNVEPKDRDIAMVFQNYALYPHMTVYNNMAFGLKLRKVPKKLRDAEKITVRTKKGGKLGFFHRLFMRTYMEERDGNGEIVKDEDGNVKYAVKTNRKGVEKRDRNGNPVYRKRAYNIDEYAGPVVSDERGVPVLVAKKDGQGNDKKNRKGETVYKLVKLTKYEIRQKVEEAARILDIVDYLDRKPRALSGGQRQRVALGRAIVREPKVFLLDEPLSNLDAKLRTAMRSEISKLYKRLQTTFVYVTHDQVEAMTMGTRIVVMKSGFVQQIDTPRNLYNYPVNKFVAGFIGTPQMNFFDCTLLLKEGIVTVRLNNTEAEFNVPVSLFSKTDASYLNGEKPVVLGIRSEHISVNPNEYPYKAKCRVFHVEDLGVDCQIYANFNLEDSQSLMENPTKVIIRAPAATKIETDSIIEVSVDFGNVHLFDAETEQSAAPRIPLRTVVKASVSQGKITLFGTKTQLPPAIRLDDGIYEVSVPTYALSAGGNISAAYVGEEDVNGTRLIEYCVDKGTVYVVADGDAKTDAGLRADLKYCVFSKDGAIVKEGVNERGRLKVGLHKIKEGNGFTYTVSANGEEVKVPEGLAQRLLTVGGKELFKNGLYLDFSAYAVHRSDIGISAAVECVEDYGDERFAKCKIGGEVFLMSVGNDFSGDDIRVNFDWDKISVTDALNDITLI